MEYKELNEISDSRQEGNSLAIREIFEQFLRKWHWFALGLILAWAAAFIYLRYYSVNLYRSEAKVLILSDPSKVSSELSALTNSIGRNDTRPNLLDQIEVMKSRRLVGKVVNNLQLNVRYFSDGRFKQEELFYETTPIKIRILSESLAYSRFEVLIKSMTKIEVTENERRISTGFGQSIKLANAEITILPQKLTNSSIGQTVHVSILPDEVATSFYKGKLSISPIDENTSVLSVAMVDNVVERASRVIDELIKQYNEDAINDKKLIGEKTSNFIDERLTKVSEDLRSKDQNVESFKKANNVIDLATEGSMNLENSSTNEKQVFDYSTQLSLVNYMQDYLRTNKEDLVPVNIGLSDAAVNGNATKYNELILAKMDMLKHSTESSQIVQNLNSQIDEVSTNLANSLNNYKKTTQISLGRLEGQGNTIASKIHRFPTQEREFKDIFRQQQIVEALYLFLLKKREENEITNSATPSPIKIVDYAYSYKSPIAPNRNSIYLYASAAGLLIPFGILYLVFLLDNKVHSRRDLQKVGPPIIGDIPKSKNDQIIGENDRGVLAESFRILRTNMNFFLTKKKTGAKNIYVTSTVAGEGKTFIAFNLANILGAAKKHSVMLLGADIRNPRLLEMWEKQQYKERKGVTHYLSDTDLEVKDLIIEDSDLTFDMIHSGVLAPNPSELLMNGRFNELMEKLDELYDYVIVDTAPVSLVTDTQLIADKADLFLFVVRANYLDRRLLEIPKDLYTNNRLPNMALLLNDVGSKGGYGYGYGYGYGNTYGYGNARPKGWKKLLPKKIYDRYFSKS